MSQVIKKSTPRCDWTNLDSDNLYRVSSWGAPYFFINDDGHMAVHIKKKSSVSIDVASVVEEIQSQGIQLPILLRFKDLLGAQIERINNAFQSAIETTGYGGLYQSVYPIKVNQSQAVVEEILNTGKKYDIGLECGSKAEFLAALPYLENDKTLLVCNGIKDRTMLSLMISMQRIGKNVIPVLDRLNEFSELKSIMWETGHSPILGARICLGSEGLGHWSSCSGEMSKFGLSLSELISLSEEISSLGLKDHFQLLHCHLGSQIKDISTLKQVVRELTQVYVSLIKRNFGIKYLDFGGGLGVQYDEAGTNSQFALNYDLQEYANLIVNTVKDVCNEQGVLEPVLITESGRAITAYHSVLIVPVLGSRSRDEWVTGDALPNDACQASKALFRLMERSTERITIEEALALFHHAKEAHSQVRASFSLGSVSLEEQATMDCAFWTVCKLLYVSLCGESFDSYPPEFIELENILAQQHMCNFSIFRSMLDHWGIGQTFPVMPIDRLNEKPLTHAILADLTCDSDGRVTHYVSSSPNKSVLPTHSFRPGKENHIGLFLLGAYQDSMGDAHNLFGKVGEAHIRLNLDVENHFTIEKVIPETSVQEILGQVQYVSGQLESRMRGLVREKYKSREVSRVAAQEILEKYMSCLQKSTYYDPKACN